VDASTARVELRLRAEPGGAADWRAWQVYAEGVALPMRHETDARGEVQVFGVRYRSFVPSWGLHPALPAQAPVRLLLRHPGHAVDHRVSLHEWQPDGGAYTGLPEDLAEASARRAERVALEVVPRDATGTPRAAPGHALGAYCLDLRGLPRRWRTGMRGPLAQSRRRASANACAESARRCGPVPQGVPIASLQRIAS
jgi:hypothetical protein